MKSVSLIILLFAVGVASAQVEITPRYSYQPPFQQDQKRGSTFTIRVRNVSNFASIQKRLDQPNTRAMLRSFREINEELVLGPGEDNLKLKIITFNTGLLSAPIYYVPHYDVRMYHLAPALRASDADVIFLQEVYQEEADTLLENELGDDYHIVKGVNPYKFGLRVLVKKMINDLDVHRDETLEYRFPTQRRGEVWAGYARGCIGMSFTVGNVDRYHYTVNCHLTAVGDQYVTRNAQAEELLENIILPIYNNRQGMIIMGGDLNASPYYHLGLKVPYMSDYVDTWKSNLTFYPMVLSSFFGIDTFASIHGDLELYHKEKHRWATLSRDNEVAKISKSCEWDPYQRLDYLFVKTLDNRTAVKVHQSKLVFTEKNIDLEDGTTIELSDHYGFMTELTFGEELD